MAWPMLQFKWGKVLETLKGQGVTEELAVHTISGGDGRKYKVDALVRNAGGGKVFVMAHPLEGATSETFVAPGVVQSICDHLGIAPSVFGLDLE